MTKRAKVIIVILLGAMVVVGFALSSRSQDSPAATQTPASTSPDQPSTPDPNGTPTTAQDSGRYVEYSEAAVAQTGGTRLLFFHADWCPQCRQLEASIKAGGIPEGVTIFKVDYDTNQALRQKYGVTIQTTVVKLGESTDSGKKFVAYEEPTLDSVIKNLLQ